MNAISEGVLAEENRRRTVREPMLPSAALAHVQALLANEFRDRPVRIYEAGGGSLSVIPVDAFKSFSVSVVDIDEVQLKNNTYASEKILGDVETYTFPENSFDIIVCHNVIEHLNGVDRAIMKFHHALRPGGLLFISAPDPTSLFGMITKFTPHWFHVLVYRALLGHKDAGKPGHHPFRTVYHPLVSPTELSQFCDKNGFEVVWLNRFLSKNFDTLKETSPAIGRVLEFAINTLDRVTCRRLPLKLGDYHAVLRKRASSGAS